MTSPASSVGPSCTVMTPMLSESVMPDAEFGGSTLLLRGFPTSTGVKPDWTWSSSSQCCAMRFSSEEIGPVWTPVSVITMKTAVLMA